jgi:hypothetical protein
LPKSPPCCQQPVDLQVSYFGVQWSETQFLSDAYFVLQRLAQVLNEFLQLAAFALSEKVIRDMVASAANAAVNGNLVMASPEVETVWCNNPERTLEGDCNVKTKPRRSQGLSMSFAS